MKSNILWLCPLIITLLVTSCDMQKPMAPNSTQGTSATSSFKKWPPLDTLIIITDFFSTAYFSCALDGTGEVVEFSSGALHFLTQMSFDNLGRQHVTSHVNASNIKVLGQTSGSIYTVTGASEISFEYLNPGTVSTTSVLDFGLRGKEANSLLILKVLYTLTSTDELKINVEDFSFVCKDANEFAKF
jgi:hypothetical protein